MKPIEFIGDALECLRGFPDDARKEAATRLGSGRLETDTRAWRGARGVNEVRIWDEAGTYRVVYVARFTEAVYVGPARFPEENGEDGEEGPGPDKGSLEGDCEDCEVKAMERQRFDNVWDALEDTPEAAENMKIRSVLMAYLQERVKGWGLTQAEAARRLGVTQPRLNDLLRGKVSQFRLDALVELLGRAGLRLEVQVKDAA